MNARTEQLVISVVGSSITALVVYFAIQVYSWTEKGGIVRMLGGVTAGDFETHTNRIEKILKNCRLILMR